MKLLHVIENAEPEDENKYNNRTNRYFWKQFIWQEHYFKFQEILVYFTISRQHNSWWSYLTSIIFTFQDSPIKINSPKDAFETISNFIIQVLKRSIAILGLR